MGETFFGKYTRLLREVVLPHQWKALNDQIPDAVKSHAVSNMRVAAGLAPGEFGGFVFQDSDLYKWLEAVGYALNSGPDAELEAWADEVIGLLEKAQQPDGYLNTYYILNGLEKRFTNLKDCHELYCLGHLIEAAVAYHAATGKRAILDVACRFADLCCKLFGTAEGQMRGYPGHEGVELALVRLYEHTGEKRYLDLAEYFINERGQEPNYFMLEWEKRGRTSHWNANDRRPPDPAYHQAHKPVREQTEAVGHSVRAVYLYAGMAAVARENGDESLVSACRTLFENIAQKQMYITGGIGQTHTGEAFTFDYDLPNNTVYSETCASIGLIFFALEMLKLEQNSRYADVMETALYNAVLAGMALNGERFFYVNPLEVWPEASAKNPELRHVLPERPKWFGCSCCPPNVARLLGSLNRYAYTARNDGVFINLFISGSADFVLNGTKVSLSQTTNYPWEGDVNIQVNPERPVSATIALRLPAWCEGPQVRVNGATISADGAKNGYLHITREWKQGDVIELSMPMQPRLMMARAEVRANAGRVAVTRGPVVFCLEGADNGTNIPAISVNASEPLRYEFNSNLLGGVGVIRASGFLDKSDDTSLYRPYEPAADSIPLTFIPYFSWANRGPNEMAVWIRAK